MSEEIRNIDNHNIIYDDLRVFLPKKYYDSEGISKLTSYYDKKYSEARTQVTDGEVTGLAFDNLEHIAKILKMRKTVTLAK